MPSPINALSAADEVLIPVQVQFLPAKGMTQLLQTESKVQRKTNTNLKVAGIVMALVDMNTTVSVVMCDIDRFYAQLQLVY